MSSRNTHPALVYGWFDHGSMGDLSAHVRDWERTEQL
jgi:hypothetical protein